MLWQPALYLDDDDKLTRNRVRDSRNNFGPFRQLPPFISSSSLSMPSLAFQSSPSSSSSESPSSSPPNATSLVCSPTVVGSAADSEFLQLPVKLVRSSHILRLLSLHLARGNKMKAYATCTSHQMAAAASRSRPTSFLTGPALQFRVQRAKIRLRL